MAVDDAYTISLLHFDGGTGSTNFIDESGRTWTPNGDVQIDTTNKKFGGGSGLFDGTGDYLKASGDTNFEAAASDIFTVDCWVKQEASGADRFIISSSNNAEFFFGFTSNAIGVGRVGVAWDLTANFTPSTDWTHFALVVGTGATTDGVRFFQNGAYIGGGTRASTYLFTTSPHIGSQGDGYYFTGNMDEFRWSRQIQRWTTNFTPETKPYGILPLCTQVIWVG